MECLNRIFLHSFDPKGCVGEGENVEGFNILERQHPALDEPTPRNGFYSINQIDELNHPICLVQT